MRPPQCVIHRQLPRAITVPLSVRSVRATLAERVESAEKKIADEYEWTIGEHAVPQYLEAIGITHDIKALVAGETGPGCFGEHCLA